MNFKIIKFLSFMTKVNPNNENEAKSWDASKSDTISFYQKILKYFNDFQNWDFSVLWLEWTQTMEMKQKQTLFHGTYSYLPWFVIHHKILKYFNDF